MIVGMSGKKRMAQKDQINVLSAEAIIFTEPQKTEDMPATEEAREVDQGCHNDKRSAESLTKKMRKTKMRR